MSLLKRFVTTVHASVDRTVAQMENHDALVAASLKDSRRAVARARVRLARVERDAEAERARIQDLETEIRLWTDRAKSVADDDRDKAIECLQRRKQRQATLLTVSDTLAKQESLAKQIRTSVTDMEQRVHQLQQQRNQMRSRESAAEALRIVNRMDDHHGLDIDDTFERWEIAVSETEVITQDILATAGLNGHGNDPFETEFLSAEEKHELDSELDVLLKTTTENSNE